MWTIHHRRFALHPQLHLHAAAHSRPATRYPGSLPQLLPPTSYLTKVVRLQLRTPSSAREADKRPSTLISRSGPHSKSSVRVSTCCLCNVGQHLILEYFHFAFAFRLHCREHWGNTCLPGATPASTRGKAQNGPEWGKGTGVQRRTTGLEKWKERRLLVPVHYAQGRYSTCAYFSPLSAIVYYWVQGHIVRSGAD